MVPSGVVRRPLSDRAGLKCTLGDAELDRLLRGGIPCGSITELVGGSLNPCRTLRPRPQAAFVQRTHCIQGDALNCLIQ